MSITTQQSRLIDEKKKNKHVEETGYDYSSQEQRDIQSLVEGNIEFEEQLRITTLIPRAGTTNGMRITQAGIAAYIAAHPQNAARKGDRLRIADLLSAGNSTLDEEPEEQEEEQESPRPSIHKRFPPVSGTSYHKAKQVVKTYLKADASNENFHCLLNSNEEIIVIDDFVGKDGEFAFAKSLENPSYGEFYISRDKISLTPDSTPSTPQDITGLDATPIGGETTPWTSLPTDKPVKISQAAEMRIALYLERTSLTTADRPAALEEAFYNGMEKILKSKGKKSTKEYIKQSFVENNFWDKPAQAYELFLNPRRVGTKVKAIVKVPIRNIIPLEDEEPEFANKEEYRTEDFKSKIEKLAAKIRDIEEKKEEFVSDGGKVSIFFPEQEASSIKHIPKNIEYIASQNSDYIKTGKNIFEDKGVLKLYWNKNAQPVMVKFYADTGKVYNFNEQMEEYKSRQGSERRTQDLLMNMNFITEGELGTPWKEFLTTFVNYKPVKIIPKKEEQKEQGEAEGGPVKTLELLQQENRYYSNVDRREEAYNKRKGQSDFAGDSTLGPSNSSKIGEIVSQDAEELYKHFINKIDIGKIALKSASCLLPDIPLQSLKKLKRDFDILEKELEKLKKEHREGKLFDFLQPDDLPTDDISDAFFKSLRKSLEGMLTQVISSMIGNLLGAFFDSCGKKDKEQSGPNPPELEGVLADLQDKMQDLFDTGFIDPSMFRDLMNDLANLLSLRELCDLLRGQADRDTLDIIKNLLETSYCQLELDSDQEVIDFFLAVSGSMDLTICDELGTIMESLPEDFICPPDSSVRDALLRGKGLTDEEIREQMERERQRNAELAEQLLGDALSGRKGPNLFCAKDEQGNTIPGAMPFMDAQFEYTFETTLSSMFRGAYDSFAEEGMRFTQNLFLEVEEEEERFYKISPPSYADVTDQDPRPEDAVKSKVLVTKRKPVPHLADFYENPEFGESTSKSLEIIIPTTAISSIDKAKELFEQSSVMNDPLLEQLESMKTALKEQNENVSKIKVTEFTHCEVLDRAKEPEEIKDTRTDEEKRVDEIKKEIGSKAARLGQINERLESSIDEEIMIAIVTRNVTQQSLLKLVKKNLQEEKVRLEREINNLQEEMNQPVYETNVLEDNECGNSEPTPQQSAREEEPPTIQQPPVQPSIPVYNFPQEDRDCETDSLLGNSISINGKEYFAQREIYEGIISFMNENVGSDKPRNKETCVQAIFNKSLELEDIDREERDRRRSAFESSSVPIAKNIRDGIYKVLMKMLEDSKYLNYQTLGGDTSGPSYDRYIMEFINLGPTPTPECDPHLLRLSQLIEEVRDGMQEAMCLDLNPSPDAEKPKMSPLEIAMMKACIKATFRHYIIETLVSGILTLTTFGGRKTRLTDLKCSYIIDKMSESMNKYSKPMEGDSCSSGDTFSGDMPNYFTDFIEQVETAYSGKNDKNNSLLRKVLREEYEEIARGLMDALLVPTTADTGILYRFLSQEVPVLSEVRRLNDRAVLYHIDGSVQKGEFNNPFVYLRKEGREYFSLVTNTISSQLTTTYEIYIMPDGSEKWVIPIIEREEPEILLVQSALFTTFFPLEDYASSLSIHEMETVSRMESTSYSFGETRDNLFSLFYAITPEKDDWGKQNKALSSVGGSSGLTKLFDFNNNVFDTPCTEFSYNFGFNGVCWGNPFAGMGGVFSTALRMARDAALLEFKKYVERNDPAVKLAKRLSFLAKLACVNVPTSAIAGGLNTALPLIFPLTPMAMAFHALGLGIFLPASLLNSDSDEGQEARNQIKNAGLRLPPYCGDPVDEKTLSEQGSEMSDAELRREEERENIRIQEINGQILEKSFRITEIDEEIQDLKIQRLNAQTSNNLALRTQLEFRERLLKDEKEELLEEIDTLRQQL